MIVYSGTIRKFNEDIDKGIIADRISTELERRGLFHNNLAEIRSWDHSLLHMKNIINTPEISDDIHVAIEYQLPTTSKRVDFIVTGYDEDDNKKVVIVELKQWEKAQRTSREDLVTTFLAGTQRVVTHPSYQAYSYAKVIENYNEYVQDESISLLPCCYLHNYKEEFRHEIDNYLYKYIIEEAPLFLKQDGLKLRHFIATHVRKTDHGKTLYEIDNGKIRPSKALQDAVVSMIKGNEEFHLIDEQKVAYSTIKKLVENLEKKEEKSTIIVEGGPGTGKSVIAINLLAKMTENKKNVVYVTKNQAPRKVFVAKMRQNKYKWSFINNMFKGSGSFVETPKNTYDLIVVDEAHRLNKKSGFRQNLGENQIKEIINASKVSVFFIDEDQVVTMADFGSIEEIEKQAKLLGSTVYVGEDLKLTAQFRCNGSEGYIAFLDHALQIRETANYDGFDIDYDIKVFDDPNVMRDELRKLNKINNKARMIAGYCYDWITKDNPNNDFYDIVLPNGFKAKWNFSNTSTWAIDEESFEQVGCIHTSQGLEFDYVGIIIGKDLYYEDGKVKTDYTKRAETDKSLRGIKTHKNYDLADKIIRNTYKTLLSRGQKGCYIYCEDKALSDHIKRRLELRLDK